MAANQTKITVPALIERKAKGEKISALTAYDVSMARLLDQAGLDVILVGDSLGNVVQGQKNTLPVTLEQMIYHCQCVSRGVSRALVVGDLPFMSYQVSAEQAVESAGRLIKEGGASAVKLEGGTSMARTIQRLAELDIPVMGHVGLRPQAIHSMGGYKIQGKTDEEGRRRVIEDAKAVADSGAFSLVLELIPAELAEEITQLVKIPTIGIGAGAACDGQVLVINDLLGMNPEFSPKFVKPYANLADTILSAVGSYVAEVRDGKFPDKEHSF